MAEIAEEILFCGQCPVCWSKFYICRRCYRGQRYCSARCRQVARRKKCQGYNLRHQQTEAGREDHRERQRAQRRHRARAEKTKESVTDQSSHRLTEDGKLRRGDEDDVGAGFGEWRRSAAPTGARCQRCGRQSVRVEPLSEARAVLWKLRQGDGMVIESRNTVSGARERRRWQVET